MHQLINESGQEEFQDANGEFNLHLPKWNNCVLPLLRDLPCAEIENGLRLTTPSRWQQDKWEVVKVHALNCSDIPSCAHYHLPRLLLPASHLYGHSRSWLDFWQSSHWRMNVHAPSGEAKLLQPFFPPPTAGICSLEEQLCPADELLKAFRGANCHHAPGNLSSSGHPWKLQWDCWKTDREATYFSSVADIVYILMKSVKSPACTITSSMYVFTPSKLVRTTA